MIEDGNLNVTKRKQSRIWKYGVSFLERSSHALDFQSIFIKKINGKIKYCAIEPVDTTSLNRRRIPTSAAHLNVPVVHFRKEFTPIYVQQVDITIEAYSCFNNASALSEFLLCP